MQYSLVLHKKSQGLTVRSTVGEQTPDELEPDWPDELSVLFLAFLILWPLLYSATDFTVCHDIRCKLLTSGITGLWLSLCSVFIWVLVNRNHALVQAGQAEPIPYQGYVLLACIMVPTATAIFFGAPLFINFVLWVDSLNK